MRTQKRKRAFLEGRQPGSRHWLTTHVEDDLDMVRTEGRLGAVRLHITARYVGGDIEAAHVLSQLTGSPQHAIYSEGRWRGYW